MNHRRLGLTKDINVGICGDARMASTEILSRLQSLSTPPTCLASSSERTKSAKGIREAWEQELDELSAPKGSEMTPRQALRELEKAYPEVVT